MSTWGDMRRRAEGEEIRREDEFRPRTIDELWEDLLKDMEIPRDRMYKDWLSSLEKSNVDYLIPPEELQEILGTL
jgi:hypothetical protein